MILLYCEILDTTVIKDALQDKVSFILYYHYGSTEWLPLGCLLFWLFLGLYISFMCGVGHGDIFFEIAYFCRPDCFAVWTAGKRRCEMAIERDANGKFAKGNRGGPGRKPISAEMRALAEEAPEKLRELAEATSTPARIRADIYMYAHDKVYGKAKQAIDVDANVNAQVFEAEMSLTERRDVLLKFARSLGGAEDVGAGAGDGGAGVGGAGECGAGTGDGGERAESGVAGETGFGSTGNSAAGEIRKAPGAGESSAAGIERR